MVLKEGRRGPSRDEKIVCGGGGGAIGKFIFANISPLLSTPKTLLIYCHL